MSFTTRTKTIGTVSPGDTFAEAGTVIHDGHEYTSGGGFVADDRLIAYLGDNNSVTTWHGTTIGSYTITKSWRVRTPHFDSYEMHQVYIRLTDGRQYQGRSQGPGMVVTAKRVASDRKVQS